MFRPTWTIWGSTRTIWGPTGTIWSHIEKFISIKAISLRDGMPSFGLEAGGLLSERLCCLSGIDWGPVSRHFFGKVGEYSEEASLGEKRHHRCTAGCCCPRHASDMHGRMPGGSRGLSLVLCCVVTSHLHQWCRPQPHTKMPGYVQLLWTGQIQKRVH